MLHKMRALLINLSVLAVTVGLFCAAAEGVLRLTGYRIPPRQVGNELLGLTLIPAHTENIVDFPEYPGGKIRMWTNNRGFLQDTDTISPKPPGTVRVAILGDSQTAGAGVNKESYAQVMQDTLNARGGPVRYEMLNGGVGKYSPYQYYIKAKTEMMPLAPDHVVVAIYLGNDLQDLIRHDDRPYLVRNPDGSFGHHRPEFFQGQDPETVDSWWANSRLYSLVERAWGPTLAYQYTRGRMILHNLPEKDRSFGTVAQYMSKIFRLSRANIGIVTQNLNQHVWFQYFPSTLPEAELFHREVLRRFHQLGRERGFTVTYLMIPTKLQIEPETVDLSPVLAVDPQLTATAIQAASGRFAELVLRHCREEGIRVIDPRAELLRRKGREMIYYPQDMHLNVRGARLLGEILADEFLPR